MSGEQTLQRVLNHVDGDLDQSMARLFALIAMPSVATDGRFAQDCIKAASWLENTLGELGFSTAVHPTVGQPVVLARHEAKISAPHVLFYAHYDVQPADPLEEWAYDPFQPSVREISPGRKIITGRGACDDKGQLMTFVEACRAWLEVTGALPVGVTMMIEGEEESGSQNLYSFIDRHRAALAADLALVCDTYMWDRETPAITTSLRGMVYEEVIVRAANRDLHSGTFGGAAQNPLHIIADICSRLRDEDGRITLPGFMDAVIAQPAATTERLRALDFPPERLLGPIGLIQPVGDPGASLIEKITTLPSCDVNGIWGGYSGEGSKTVIPSQAGMKVSFRLVPGQEPEQVRTAFRAFVETMVPADCKVSFTGLQGAAPVRVCPDSTLLDKAGCALADEWGRDPVLVGSGGSVPIIAALQQQLGLEPLMIGFALREDRVHAPNEKYELSSFHKGIRSWVRILAALAT